MTSLSLTTRTPAELAVDTLVVGSVRTPDGADLATGHGLPRKAVVHLQAVLSDLEATGKADEVVRVVAVPGVKATSVVVTGLGDGTPPPARPTRTPRCAPPPVPPCAACAASSTVAVALPTPDVESLSAVADGAYAGCYAYDKAAPLGRAPRRPASGPRSAAPASGPRVMVVSGAGQGKAAKDAVARAAVLGAARDWARDLVNTPPNHLFPQSFADNVKKRVAASSARRSRSRCSTRRRSPRAASAASSASARARSTRRGSSRCRTSPAVPEGIGRPGRARASPSTPAASTSSRRPAW